MVHKAGRALVVGVLAGSVVGACGAPPEPSTSGSSPATPPPTAPARTSPSATPELPGTTLLVPPVRDDPLVASVVPVEVTEPCPESTGGPDGMTGMQDELARLEPMLGIVLAYGGQYPEEFGSYGLVWHGLNDASVFISFTTDLDRHREALNGHVAHPDELVVCQVAVSGAVSAALAAKLTDELAGRFSFVGVGMTGVEVELLPGEEALADELVARYGDAVAVTVCADTATCGGSVLVG